MTPSPYDQNQQPQAGWRGDGRNVPGNQRGGANGRYGRYGQRPDARIPQEVSDDISRSAHGADQGMRGGAPQMGQNIGQIAQGLHNRYGGQGRRDHAMNSQMQDVRRGDMQSNISQMQQTEPMQSPMADAQPEQQYGQQTEPTEQLGMNDQQPQGVSGVQATPMDEAQGYQQQPATQPMAQSYGNDGAPPQAPAQTSMTDPQPQPATQPMAQSYSNDSAPPQAPAQTLSQPTPAATPTAPTSQPASTGKSSMASPFGTMHFDQNAGAPQQQAMARGGIVTHPTRAILGENGPEAVIPLDNPNANVTAGMFSPRRYRANTGPSSLNHPLPPMAPAPLDPSMHKQSGWKRWEATHGKG